MRNDPAPPQIPDYQLLRKIGQGSYGVVWLAQGITGVYRAVKIVWRASFEDPQPYEREFRGIKEFAAVSLIEPRQLALLHVGRNDEAGFFYYVMELADDAASGREIDPERYVPHTLREVRTRRGRLKAEETLTLGVDLAGALAGLHAHELVHRDIKPSNIIFVGGVPKLADIGLVTSAATTALTMSRVGNPGYMPPDLPGTPSADVYGLGKVLYELATGRERDDYPRLPVDLDKLPDRKALLELNEIFVRACHANPEKRYGDAAALRDDLLLLQAGKSVRRLRAAERHLGRAMRATAMLGIAATVAVAGAWIEHRRAARAEAERDALARKSVYSASLTKAQRALENNEPGRARRHLRDLIPAAGLPDLRGFEWYAMWNEAQGDAAIVAQAGGEIIKRVVLSPDQRSLAGQVGDDRTIVWDAQTLKEVRRIKGTRLLGGFSSDGRWIVGTNQAQGFQRWQIASGEPDSHASTGLNYPLHALGRDQVWGMLRSEQGFAIGLRRWSFGHGAEEISLPLEIPNPGAWIFTPFPAVRDDGASAVVSLFRQNQTLAEWRLQVYDLTARRLAHELATNIRATAVALSPDGLMVAAALGDAGAISVFDLHTKQCQWQKPAGIGIIESLSFSPDSRQLLAGGASSTVRVLDTNDGKVVGEYHGHDVGVVALQWKQDGSGFYSADSGGDLRFWDLQKPKIAVERTRPGYATESWNDVVATRAITVSPDGTAFAASDRKSGLRVSTVVGNQPEAVVEARFPLDLSVGGKRLTVLTSAGVLKTYCLQPEPIEESSHPLLPPDAIVSCAALSQNQKLLIAGSPNGQVWLWNYQTRELVRERHAGQSVLWVAAAPSGNVGMANGRDNLLRIWSAVDGDPLGEFRTGAPRRVAHSGAMSPDGRLIALCLETCEIEIRSIANIESPRRLRVDSARTYAIAFSPDGTRLYCGGANGSVHVYATDDWRWIVSLDAPSPPESGDNAVIGLATSATSNAVLAYRADGTIRIWNTSLFQ